jgi:hypothetical protein
MSASKLVRALVEILAAFGGIPLVTRLIGRRRLRSDWSASYAARTFMGPSPYDSGLMAELVPRPGLESHEPVVNARELLAHAFREYELAGGTK